MASADEVHEATNRLIRSVDAMTDAQYADPSLLPGWTRGHVVAHLVLNAEGLADALHAVTDGRTHPMYPSQQRRDAAVQELGTAAPDVLRNGLFGATMEFTRAYRALPATLADHAIERTPGGPTFPAGAAADMREREVRIHHVDLDLGHSPAEWPLDFCARLLDFLSTRPQRESFTVSASDLDRTWQIGPEAGTGPRVSGSAADLGWWLSGRPPGAVTSDTGMLPEVDTL